MNKNYINILKKYLTDEYKVSIVNKDKLTLENWQELEEAAKEVQENYPDVGSATGGAGRRWFCLIGEIEQYIRELGGKLYEDRKNDDNRERERERERAKLRVEDVKFAVSQV